MLTSRRRPFHPKNGVASLYDCVLCVVFCVFKKKGRFTFAKHPFHPKIVLLLCYDCVLLCCVFLCLNYV